MKAVFFLNSRQGNARAKAIAEAVKTHREILRAWTLLSDIMSPNLFFEFSFSAYILCSILFGIVFVSSRHLGKFHVFH